MGKILGEICNFLELNHAILKMFSLNFFFCLRLNSFGNGMDPTSVDPPLAAGLGNFDDYDLHSDLLNDFLDGEVISKKILLGLYQKF